MMMIINIIDELIHNFFKLKNLAKALKKLLEIFIRTDCITTTSIPVIIELYAVEYSSSYVAEQASTQQPVSHSSRERFYF